MTTKRTPEKQAPEQQASATIYQLKITLRGSKPPIWRRILVPDSTLLSELHRAIQDCMGWEDCHLHGFEKGRVRYESKTDPMGFRLPYFGENGEKDEAKVQVKQLLTTQKDKLSYTYDYGDNWEHEIVLEKILPYNSGEEYPQLVTGARRCPPEDSGGIWGYAAMLEALQSPDHPDYGEYQDWLETDFDPEDFDLDGLRAQLRYKGGSK